MNAPRAAYLLEIFLLVSIFASKINQARQTTAKNINSTSQTQNSLSDPNQSNAQIWVIAGGFQNQAYSIDCAIALTYTITFCITNLLENYFSDVLLIQHPISIFQAIMYPKAAAKKYFYTANTYQQSSYIKYLQAEIMLTIYHPIIDPVSKILKHPNQFLNPFVKMQQNKATAARVTANPQTTITLTNSTIFIFNMKVGPDNQQPLPKWLQREVKHPKNRPLAGGDSFSGPTKDRVCTDAVFMIVFIILNTGLIAQVVYILIEGDINRLSFGHDFRAEICGVDGLSDRQYKYYPDPYNLDIPLCIEECPTEVEADSICYYDTDYNTLLKEWGCWDSIPSTAIGFYCIPSGDQERENVVEEMYDGMETSRRVSGDVILAWDAIVLGVLSSLIIGFLFTNSFKKEENMKALSYGCIIVNVLCLASLCLLFWISALRDQARLCEDDGEVKADYCPDYIVNLLVIFGIVIIAISVIYMLTMIVARDKIKQGVQVIRLAGRPYMQINTLQRLPLAIGIVGVLLLGLLIAVILWTLGLGQITSVENNSIPGGQAQKIEFSEIDAYLVTFSIFMTFWWLVLISDIGEFVVATACSIWYFNKEKSLLDKPIERSIKYAFRYHFGSIVLGALVNPLCKPFILIFSWMHRDHHKHKCIRTTTHIACYPCAQSYLFYMKYFTRFAFAYQSIFSGKFWEGAQQSYFLIRRNVHRIWEPLECGTFTLNIVKLSITLIGPTITFLITALSPVTPIYETQYLVSWATPAFFTLISCSFVAQFFIGALESSLSSLIISAAADEELFTRNQRFIDNEFIGVLDKVHLEENANEIEAQQFLNVQLPNKSHRIPTNMVKFDDNLNPIGLMPTSYRVGQNDVVERNETANGADETKFTSKR